jgi:hypothetical protein
VSKTNAVNKGRDYYRAQQEHFRGLRKRRQYPWPIGEQEFEVIHRGKARLQKFEVVGLSDRQYRRERVKNKIYTVPHAVGPYSKPVTIPYQTCTLVRVREA